MIEQKGRNVDLLKPAKQSDGQELTPFRQAKRYADELEYSRRPRWIVVCNFQEFQIYDMNRPNDEPETLRLANLEKEYHRLQFLVDTGSTVVKKEMEVSLQAGEITTSDVFNVSSLGSGGDGTPGYPLISVWITGKELRDAFEVDASVSPLMSEAQIYGAGMTWSWNPRRMIFNKVYDCAQVLPDGSTVPIENDRLYRVVTGLYTGQMLGTVNAQSYGILTITPKDADGNVITDFEEHILHNPNGSEVKEWYALASYLRSMGTVDERYAAPEGRKTANPTWNPLNLLRGLNLFGALAVGLAVLVLALMLYANGNDIYRFFIK